MEFEPVQTLSIAEKRKKIQSNYETINVLKDRLDKGKAQQRFGMTRAAYIKMIFDATEKVDKQNDELSKVISDVRMLQKDISNLSGRLERSFTLVGEIFLRNAKDDVWNRECYRLLGTMHENCYELIQAVQETDDIKREIKQLEDEIGRMVIPKHRTMQ